MEWLSPLLPTTVIAAVVLFVVKEAIEKFRRWQADKRKGQAFRLLLARECELNHWAIKKLKEALVSIQDLISTNIPFKYRIDRRSSGEVFFVELYDDGTLHSASPLPEARTDLMRQIMLDVAALDSSLFVCMEAAYDSTINLRHV